MSEEEQERQQGGNSYRQTGTAQYPIINDVNTLHFRFSNNPIMQNLVEFLTGKRMIKILNEETEEQEVRYEDIGEPKCNSEGVRTLSTYVFSNTSTQALQGYIEKNDIRIYVAERREELNDIVFDMLELYEINVLEHSHMVDQLMIPIKVATSHAREGKTMQLISQSTQSKEVIENPREKASFWKMFSNK